jgi:F0F1-type ATP synthase delta subunit
MASIPNRYAKALYQLVGSDLAKARKLRESFDGLNQLFELKDSARVLRSPVMPPDLKRKLLDYALDTTQAAPEVKQLTTALLAAGRVDLLPEVAKSFNALLDQADGRSVAPRWVRRSSR